MAVLNLFCALDGGSVVWLSLGLHTMLISLVVLFMNLCVLFSFVHVCDVVHRSLAVRSVMSFRQSFT